MDTLDNSNPMKIHNFRTIAGILLILAGGILFLDRFLKTGWLSLLVLPGVGFSLYLWGFRRRHVGLIIAGGLVAAVGLGCMVAWGPAVRLDMTGKIDLTIVPHALLTQLGYITLYTGI